MLKRLVELMTFCCAVFAIFFFVLALSTWRQHSAMKRGGREVSATVLRTFVRESRSGNSPLAHSFAFIASVRFQDPAGTDMIDFEYTFPERDDSVRAGSVLPMVYDPASRRVVLKSVLDNTKTTVMLQIAGGLAAIAGGAGLVFLGRRIPPKSPDA